MPRAIAKTPDGRVLAVPFTVSYGYGPPDSLLSRIFSIRHFTIASIVHLCTRARASDKIDTYSRHHPVRCNPITSFTCVRTRCLCCQRMRFFWVFVYIRNFWYITFSGFLWAGSNHYSWRSLRANHQTVGWNNRDASGSWTCGHWWCAGYYINLYFGWRRCLVLTSIAANLFTLPLSRFIPIPFYAIPAQRIPPLAEADPLSLLARSSAYHTHTHTPLPPLLFELLAGKM